MAKAIVTQGTTPVQVAWLRLVGPPQPLNAEQAVAVLAALHNIGTPLVLEIRASADAVELIVGCADWRASEVERAIHGIVPDWALSEAGPVGTPETRMRLVSMTERPGVPLCLPLLDLRSFDKADPLTAILEAVQPLTDNEYLQVQYLVRPAGQQCRQQVARELSATAPLNGLIDVISMVIAPGPRPLLYSPALQRSLAERLAGPAYEVIGTVTLAGGDPRGQDSRARSLASVFAGLFDAGFGGLKLRTWGRVAGPDSPPVTWRNEQSPLFLPVGELAALWHLPSSHVQVPGVVRLRRASTSLPLAVERAPGIQLGTHHHRGKSSAIHLPRPDLEAGHAVILGRTGVGKSTLNHQLLRQLIAATDRPAVGVLDPHGDLSLDIAARSIPAQREPDVVLLELGDEAFPVGLPLFSSRPDVSMDLQVQTTFSLLRLIFREHWSPTRMEDAVFALTTTLCRMPGATLLDIPRLFGEAVFRRRALTTLDDPIALEFWSEYEQLSEAARRELVRPVLYRLRGLYRSRAVRNILCQTRGLDFQQLLDSGAIILVSLAGPGIQAEADLLGELIIAQLHLAAMTRLGRPREQRKPLYLAVDESQRFRGASLPVLLSEGRKLGLALLLSTQFLDGWGDALSDSVLGNVGTLVAFRSGASDSRRLAPSLRPFTPEHLEDLDRYEAIVKLQIGGATMPAFDIRTLPLDAPRSEDAMERIRTQTRRLYARTRREVEDGLVASVPVTVETSAWQRVDITEE